jgi:hypothetical protein
VESVLPHIRDADTQRKTLLDDNLQLHFYSKKISSEQIGSEDKSCIVTILLSRNTMMQDADSMPSLLLTACVLSKSVQYTFNCPPGTLRRLDMQRLESSLGLRLAVLQTCKVPASRAATRLKLRRSTTCQHKIDTQTMHAFPIYISKDEVFHSRIQYCKFDG